MKLYIIPGLGFDHRVFQNLDLKAYSVEYLDWIEPHPNGSLRDYSVRMVKRLNTKDMDNEMVLIGHSFGGMLCQEIAQLIKVRKIIIISSIRSKDENPLRFKVIAPPKLHLLFNKALIFSSFPLWAKPYGYRTKQEQQLFKSMVAKHSNHYLRWALRELSIWKTPNNITTPIIQIHGTKDRVFPFKLIKKPDHVVENGNHFMVYKEKEAKKISEIIHQELGDLITTER